MSKEKKNSMRPHWMPLYVEKFLADTSGFTPTEGGAYINLLCACGAPMMARCLTMTPS